MDRQTDTPHARVRAPPRPRVPGFQRRPGSWNAGEPSTPLVTAVEFPFRSCVCVCVSSQARQACEHEMNVRRVVLKWGKNACKKKNPARFIEPSSCSRWIWLRSLP